MVGFPHPFAGSALGFEGAPVPLSAVYVPGSPNTIVVTFDTPLVTDLLDQSRWSGRYNDQDQAINQANAEDFDVVLQVADAGADIGADVVSYDDAAADVRSKFLGIPAVSFANFPVT